MYLSRRIGHVFLNKIFLKKQAIFKSVYVIFFEFQVTSTLHVRKVVETQIF